MRVELNGKPVKLSDRATVAEAVDAAGADSGRRGIAVAVDGEVVPRTEWPRRQLRTGQRIEVVHAIQGG